MRKIILGLIVFLSVTQSFAQNAGYEVLRITDESRKRPIQIDVWYPATEKEKEYNYGFSKGSVVVKSNVASKQLPLVLFSHGAMGAASNYSWLGEYLARLGYLVAGISHFGESPVFGFDSVDQNSVSRFGDRTKDLNFALEFMLLQSKYAENIDFKRIGAIGHSSGGATVLMLNGAEFSFKNLIDYCQKAKPGTDKGCQYPRSTETDTERLTPIKSMRSLKAIVALDPAVGQGFTKKGLKSLSTPTLIVGSVQNDFLPFEFHAGYLAKQLKKVENVKLDSGEGHFVYLDECKLPIKVMEVALCSDRENVERKEVHKKLSVIIENFLKRNL